MEIECTIINKTGINDQQNLLRLLDRINGSKAGLYKFIVYPNYDSTAQINTLDSFVCIADGYYDIDKVHDFLNVGNIFKIKFIENIPNKLFVPKVPIIAGSQVFGIGSIY